MRDETDSSKTDHIQHDNPFAAPIATEANPLSAYGVPNPEHMTAVSRLNMAVSGAVWTILLAIPIAALLGLIFRFPVPFVGYMSGPSAVVPALFAVLFYGLALGGFVWLGLLGAVIGVCVPDAVRNDRRRVAWIIRIWAAGMATVNLLVLSILDMIIGPF